MIEVNDVTKRYGDTVAVDQLSFAVQSGIVTGFLGPNGAGKTTTMRMILGLDRPTSGSVTVNGRPYQDLPAPMQEVGALLEAKAIQGGRTARQHLRWIARAGGLAASRVDEVLELVGLKEVANRKAGDFSLGMSQRLGIATALGRTVFLSSHLMSEMEETADHIIVIGRGRLIADASIAEFTQHSAASHVRVVSPQAMELAPLLTQAGATVTRGEGALTVTGMDAGRIGSLAAEHRIELHELTSRRASLETAFMELTQQSQEYQAGAPLSDMVLETAQALVGTER